MSSFSRNLSWPCSTISIREAAGTTLKSSLTHTWNYGSIDTMTPNESLHIKTFQVGQLITILINLFWPKYQEIAGLGGSAAFLKTYNQARVVRPITSNTVRTRLTAPHSLSWVRYQVLSLSARFGLVYPLFSQRVHFSDRFQAGGPLDVRMFRMNSLGPKDGCEWLNIKI